MGMSSSLGGLRSIFGAGEVTSTATPVRSTPTSGATSVGDDMATFSNMGSAVSLSGTGSGIRPGKIASIQAAMNSGGYSVSASAVSTKIVDFMMGSSA
jgi:anti-sigma28 factor (negative regulator of flagellin synthesis)